MPLLIRTVGTTLIFFLLILINSCTTTITKQKNPAFSVEVSTIQKDMKLVVTCENINLSGTETSTNGKINSELEISIINGKNIPTDDNQIFALGKSIATYIKKELKDQNEYNQYKVLFVKRETLGESTKRTWVGYAYKAEEL